MAPSCPGLLLLNWTPQISPGPPSLVQTGGRRLFDLGPLARQIGRVMAKIWLEWDCLHPGARISRVREALSVVNFPG